MPAVAKNIRRYNTIDSQYGNISFFNHVTNESAAEVQAAGYFNDVANLFEDGDIVTSVVDYDGTPNLVTHRITKPETGDITVAVDGDDA